MTLRASKPAFNVREKLTELGRRFGLKGSELAAAETVQEARDLVSAGRKNLMINGRFDFWQRGTSFTGTEYTADRWYQALSGGTATVSRQAFTLGQTEVPGNPVYYLQQSCSVGNGNCGINQKIEDVRTGAGGPVTVSFWAKGTNPPGYGYWAMQLWQRFGTGGSPSGAVQNNKQLTVTANWKKYSFTYELDSVSGKTLGSDNNHNVDLIIRQHESDNDTGAWELNLANVQVEFGRNATEFEHRSYGEELALCQRYYLEKSIGYGRLAHFRTSALMLSMFDLPVVMRSSASASVTATNINAWAYNDGNGITVSSVNASGTGVGGSTANIMFNVTAGGSANSQVFYFSNGVIKIDAEL